MPGFKERREGLRKASRDRVVGERHKPSVGQWILTLVAALAFGAICRKIALGTLFGSLFLVPLVTAMQVAGLKIGGQFVAKGLFIILAAERIRQ